MSLIMDILLPYKTLKKTPNGGHGLLRPIQTGIYNGKGAIEKITFSISSCRLRMEDLINDWESDWLLKVDPDGNELWKKSISGIAVTSFQQTRDGGYLLGGNKRFSSDNFGGYMIAKTDSNANQQWTRTFENELTSGLLFQWAKTSAEIDGGYIILGNFAPGDMESDFKLIKLTRGKTPSALFTYEPEYPGVNQTVTLDASGSYDPNGYITGYMWDFGDGSKENTTN